MRFCPTSLEHDPNFSEPPANPICWVDSGNPAVARCGRTNTCLREWLRSVQRCPLLAPEGRAARLRTRHTPRRSVPTSKQLKFTQPSHGPSRCPACHGTPCTVLFEGTDRFHRTTTYRYRIVECAACGVIRLDPCPSPAELASFHPELYWWEAVPVLDGRLAQNLRRWARRDQVRFVEQSIRRPGPVLDIGCGGGVLTTALQERGMAIFACDVFCPPLQQIHRANGIPSVCCRLPDSCFLPQSFGTVLAFHVFEHLADPYECLLTLRETIEPGGNLIIQLPNADCWQALMLSEYWNGLRRSSPPAQLPPGGHRRLARSMRLRD